MSKPTKLRDLIKEVKKEEQLRVGHVVLRTPLEDQLSATMAVLAFLEEYEGDHPILGPLAHLHQTQVGWVPSGSQLRKAHDAICRLEQLEKLKEGHNSLTDPKVVGINTGKRRRQRRSRSA